MMKKSKTALLIFCCGFVLLGVLAFFIAPPALFSLLSGGACYGFWVLFGRLAGDKPDDGSPLFGIPQVKFGSASIVIGLLAFITAIFIDSLFLTSISSGMMLFGAHMAIGCLRTQEERANTNSAQA